MSGIRLCGSKPRGRPSSYFHRLGGHHTLARADPTDAAHPLLAAEHLLLNQQAFLAVVVDDELRGPVAERWVNIVMGSSIWPSESMTV